MTRRLTLPRFALGMSLVVAGSAAVARGQEATPGDEPADPRPVLSANERWVRPFALGVAALFAAAAVVGPLVRRDAPGAVPDATSHEEDPGADRA